MSKRRLHGLLFEEGFGPQLAGRSRSGGGCAKSSGIESARQAIEPLILGSTKGAELSHQVQEKSGEVKEEVKLVHVDPWLLHSKFDTSIC